MSERYSHKPNKSFKNFLEQDSITKRLIELRNQTTPEREYLIAALATIFYSTVLVDPKILPLNSEHIFSFLHQTFPGWDSMLGFSTLVTAGLTVDGAKRIATESLPLYKAWARYTLEDMHLLKKK